MSEEKEHWHMTGNGMEERIKDCSEERSEERSEDSSEMMSATGKGPELKLWYEQPATDWEREALPLGNGFLGAMVFGGVPKDRIQINEHSLWSGGPGADPEYNGGHSASGEEAREALQKVRVLLQKNMSDFTRNHKAHMEEGKIIAGDYAPEEEEVRELLGRLMGDKTHFGDYQSLGEIIITDVEQENKTDVCRDDCRELYPDREADVCNGDRRELPPDGEADVCTEYRRELHLNQGKVTISFQRDGAGYEREYFASYPDRLLVIRYSCSQRKKLSCQIGLQSDHKQIRMQAGQDRITLQGSPEDQGEKGLKFAAVLKVIPIGGNLAVKDQTLVVTQADEILLLFSAGTNYLQCTEEGGSYFHGEDPLIAVGERIDTASRKSYEQLLKVHTMDYRSLFDRVGLGLGQAQPSGKSTDRLLSGYHGCGEEPNDREEDLYLELLYYQYGRYLLIASSREGSLPANLQGIWAQGLSSPWNSDYHTNINLQMNYWLAGPGNLRECHLPLIAYINSLVFRGRASARHYYCRQDGSDVRGWVTHHENNIWGNTAPGTYYFAFYFPAAAAWLCQDIWEYYRFHQDEKFLRDNFNTMLEAALFWVDNLWEDERDHTLVANPSYSPEHGPYTLGAACDQQIIWEIFTAVIQAGQTLSLSIPELTEIREARSRLSGPRIGLAGQFMEWKDEVSLDISGDQKHRHANHLYALHPGTGVIPARGEADALFGEAMKQTLKTRGDGGTGWSKAWKINFWARLRDGNRAHRLLEELLKESTLPNLFDTHPPFQIDGNLGAAAGMTEMLIQSHGEDITLLPALPKAWNRGFCSGIKARGDFELSLTWEDGMLRSALIRSGAGRDCTITYPDIVQLNPAIHWEGREITFHQPNKDTLSFPTIIEGVYRLTTDRKADRKADRKTDIESNIKYI